MVNLIIKIIKILLYMQLLLSQYQYIYFNISKQQNLIREESSKKSHKKRRVIREKTSEKTSEKSDQRKDIRKE